MRISESSRILPALLALFLAGALSASFAAETNTVSPAVPGMARLMQTNGYVAIPLRLAPSGHLQCDGFIDGKAVVLVVDSGAPLSAMDAEKAAALGLKITPLETHAAGLGTSTMKHGETLIGSLKLGDWEARRVYARTIDLKQINAVMTRAGARSADGMLGANLLMECQAVIDFTSRTLFLKNPQK